MTNRLDRRRFLAGAASLGGAVLLGGCGSSSGGGSSAASTVKRPPIGSEPGNLSIYEWQGYEAAGTKAQTYMTVPGKSYVDKWGADSLTYTAFPDDDTAVNKVAATGPGGFDLMHPCISYVRDWQMRGLIQPFDTKLLSNWDELDPNVTKAGFIDGQQWWVPWDSGYSSIMYRKDKIAPADATGWELFWNEKYKGHISMWDGGSTPIEIGALVNGDTNIYDLSDAQIEASKNKLIQQKPLNLKYWHLEYDDMQPAFKSGDFWVTYAWPNDFNDMLVAGLDVGWLEPSQGQLAWYCGFIMSKDTKNYYHCHEYVDSFIGHDACVDLGNAFVYASANLTVKASDLTVAKPGKRDSAYAQPEAVAVLNFGDPNRVAPPVHLEQFIPQRAAYQQAWDEVKAS